MKSLMILILSLFVCISSVYADSLWSAATAADGSLFVDLQGPNLQVNDIVTMLIDESTAAKADADTDADVEDSIEGSISNWFSVENIGNLFDLLSGNNSSIKTQQNTQANLPKWGIDINHEFSGEGETSRNNSVTAKISTRVVAIEPNGNIVLEGKKRVRVNQEETVLTVTGIVRKADISADFTVPSSVVAELNFGVEGKGIIGNVNRRGILSWLLGFVR